MRPYLAILVDSFREALHSRVLWTMFAVIAVVLAFIFPLHIEDKLNDTFSEADVVRWDKLAAELLKGKPDEKGDVASKPIGKIYAALKPECQNNLPKMVPPPAAEPSADPAKPSGDPAKASADSKGASPEEGFGAFFAEASRIGLLQLEMQRIIRDLNLYEPEQWTGVEISSETEELVKKGDNRTNEERRRLNRLLVEQLFPETIAKSNTRVVALKYGFARMWDVGFPPDMIRKLIPTYAALVVDYTFGSVGIFLAFLVAAPLITQMFETGSLHVMLSKPVSRSLLLLSKFLGGCIFTALGSAFMLFGVWLYMGVQLNIWEHGLFGGIVVYVFIFAVYFSVTLAAAMYWRNAMVAIVVGSSFWLFCSLITNIYYVLDLVVHQVRPRSIVIADGSQLIVWQNGLTFRIGDNRWRSAYQPADQAKRMTPSEPILGPKYVPSRQELMSVQRAIRGQESNLSAAKSENSWARSTGPTAPTLPKAMIVDKKGELLFVTAKGIQRLRAPGEQTGASNSIFGFKIPFADSGDYETVGAYDLESPPESAAYDPLEDRIVLVNNGQMAMMKRNGEGRFEQQSVVKVSGDEFRGQGAYEGPKLGFAGNQVVVVGREGKVTIVDAKTLAIIRTMEVDGRNVVRFVETSTDGKTCAIGFANGNVYLYRENDRQRFQPLNSWWQGEVWAVTFEDDQHILAAQDRGRLLRYTITPPDGPQIAATSVETIIDPTSNFAERFFYWGVKPLYNICPKPGDLSRTLTYLLTGKESFTFGGSQGGVELYHGSPWSPLINSSIFMAVVLGISCLYFERQDL
jgi:ABC-type transport system involved in multi-copper enzyme maturation permease subunit